MKFFSDGSSDNVKAKNAGWASIYIPDDQTYKTIVYYGHLEPKATNNQGELLGIIVCMLMMKIMNVTGRTIYSDSEYAINMLRPNSSWQATKNSDLIYVGRELSEQVSPKLLWVKGHAGIELNELADKYAGMGRKQIQNTDSSIITKYFSSRSEIDEFILFKMKS